MKYRLAELLDIPRLQILLDTLYHASNIPSAIIDADGNILTGSGWQDVCTKFHRIHPGAEERCVESDRYIESHIQEAKPSVVYKCPHGLVDAATPIIVEGIHLGNVFTGQLLFEAPDLDFFLAQAKRYGFEEERYIEAVKKVPVISDQVMEKNLAFIANFTQMLAETGFRNKREMETERQLKESEDRYRDLVEHSRDLICTHDMAGRLRSLNPLPAKILGYSRDELLSANMRDLVAPEFREKFDSYLEKMRNEGAADGILVVLARSGERRIWEYHNTLRTEGVAEPIVRGMARDITEPMMAKKSLEESEERFRKIFEEASIGMVLTTRNMKFLSANPAFCRMLGYTTEEMNGKTFLDITHPEHLEEDRRSLKRMWQGEIPYYRTEKKYIAKNGDIRWGYLSVSPIRKKGGEPLYALAMIEDITERKAMEDALRNNEELLRQSQKMEAVGRLAGGIAHDFNNLLTVINGYGDLLLAQLDGDSPLYREAEEIKRAGERAAVLTRQLLAFSRKQVLQPKVLDLNDVVSGMSGMLRRLIGEDIEFQTDFETGLGKVKADPGQIEQVIVNLVVNARDAMPGGGKLRISSANFSPDGAFLREHPSAGVVSHVCLTVRDNGTGMDAEAKSHMFEPFFTTKEKGKGTGLGLSTVYGIVNQSGGHISVASDIGKGTSVRVCLPCVEEEAERLREVPDKGLYGRERLLVVEDEDAVRGIVERILAEKGYRVLSAGDGKEGLRLFEIHKDSIDLLVTDVVMPGMGGKILAERVEAVKPGMKVLYMSGYTDDAINRRGVLDPGLSFLQKPFTPDELLKKVREILDRPSSR